jgi:hypothetical protein
MKALSALLSIYVLFLVAAPSLQFISFIIEKCQSNNSCSQSCEEQETKDTANNCCNKRKKPDPADNCCNMACNPFMLCCNIHALTSQKMAISAAFIYSTQKYRVLSEMGYSHFLSDAWKPPRIV